MKILQAVNHPNIIQLEDVVDCENFLFIVLELAEGGELFEKMTRKVRLDEASSKLIFYQLSSAIEYLHSTNICHRQALSVLFFPHCLPKSTNYVTHKTMKVKTVLKMGWVVV